MSPANPRLPDLSEGARSLVAQYSETQASVVVERAAELSPDEILTARDIRDAIRLIEHDQEAATRSLLFDALMPRQEPVSMLVMLAGGLSLLAGVLALAAHEGWLRASGDVTTWVVVALTYGAASITFTTYFLAARRAKRVRAYALRFAEANARHPLLADRTSEIEDHSPDDDEARDLDASVKNVRFIAGWAQLEDRIRRLAQVTLDLPAATASDYPIGTLLNRLLEAGVFTSDVTESLREVLSTRNRVAHGASLSSADSEAGLHRMATLTQFLDEHISRRSPQRGEIA